MAASGVAAPTRTEVLQLYRSLLRVARQFCDYNIREYSKRRTIDAFRDNKNLTDPSQLSAAFSDGKAQLEVAKRQALVYSLYAPKRILIEAFMPANDCLCLPQPVIFSKVLVFCIEYVSLTGMECDLHNI
ncbi:hypothetical protein Goari_007065 [Gossypium aridum]|uniref:Complex 1 LYR protein domain-containing protein n=1 Tax=Gossypium aridum TaxID=34290 RepID=A0A7J8XPZ1_GOSAI|nr:hypothetical protein [Gossypium aridum]